MPKISILHFKKQGAGLPGCPVGKALSCHCRDRGQSLVGELRLLMGHCAARKKKKSKAKQKQGAEQRYSLLSCMYLSVFVFAFFCIEFLNSKMKPPISSSLFTCPSPTGKSCCSFHCANTCKLTSFLKRLAPCEIFLTSFFFNALFPC